MLNIKLGFRGAAIQKGDNAILGQSGDCVSAP